MFSKNKQSDSVFRYIYVDTARHCSIIIVQRVLEANITSVFQKGILTFRYVVYQFARCVYVVC